MASKRCSSRTAGKPCDALIRLCVRDAVVCSMFSLAARLPSMPSANGFPLLFGHFVGWKAFFLQVSGCKSKWTSPKEVVWSDKSYELVLFQKQ